MIMTFEDYQKKALITDSSRGKDTLDPDFLAVVLGLSGEAGEISEKFKKLYWHKRGVWDDDDKKSIAKELGDLLWYISSISSHAGISLESIAENNIAKLADRANRGVLHGNGDNR